VTSRASCVVLTGPEDVQVQMIDRTLPGPGWVAVRTERAGICGSDLHTYRRGHPWRPYPLKPGHEAAGVLAELGAGVAGLSVGESVYLMPEMPCGECACCVRGQANLCIAPGGVGGSVPGAMADFFLAPQSCVRRVPRGVSVRAASLIEPLAAALHAVARGGPVTERAVVVIGGMGSILGSILTGLSLGVVEGLTKVFYPEASNVVVFVIMAIVLVLRPAGLFGRER